MIIGYKNSDKVIFNENSVSSDNNNDKYLCFLFILNGVLLICLTFLLVYSKKIRKYFV